MQNLPAPSGLPISGISTLVILASSDSVRKTLPLAGNRMPNKTLSTSTIFSIMAILSFGAIAYHVSASSLPGTRSMIIYSEPSEFEEEEADESQPRIFGIGMPCIRRNSMVATSLSIP
jgi:hypothetical protein